MVPYHIFGHLFNLEALLLLLSLLYLGPPAWYDADFTLSCGYNYTTIYVVIAFIGKNLLVCVKRNLF